MKSLLIYLFLLSGFSGCNRIPDPPVHKTQSIRAGTTLTADGEANRPDPAWSEFVFQSEAPLLNVPRITLRSIDEDEFSSVHLTVENLGTTTLEYSSTPSGHITVFQEDFIERKWTCSDWNWCGMGQETLELAPNESATIVINFWDHWDHELPRRMLGIFKEKGTNRSDFVVLAAKTAD